MDYTRFFPTPSPNGKKHNRRVTFFHSIRVDLGDLKPYRLLDMPYSKLQRLDLFYGQFSGDHHILILINADPDSIGSAMAVKRLLWRKAASITISHVNTVKRRDKAGGHKTMARSEIPVSDLEGMVDVHNDKKLLLWIIKRINERKGN